MAQRSRIWLVTGVSTGLGAELATYLLEKGETVIGTVRRREHVAGFEALAPGRAHARLLDVTDAAAIGPMVESVLREFGHIDVLVNNAGYGLFGAVEELSEAEGRQVMETNFFGLLNLTRAVLPHMRARRSGHIINISSVAGLMGIPGCGLYNASKFAVTGLSEALAQEMAPYNVRVTVVAPGGFRTQFSGGSLSMAQHLMPEYADTPAARPRNMRDRFHGAERGDPRKAAAALFALVNAPSAPVHLLLGPDALAMIRGKLETFGSELAAWEATTCSTNYDA
jgi:NAD(P)-dependent dehydrogenase (short-subunit alcohol dehydrogenase family)